MMKKHLERIQCCMDWQICVGQNLETSSHFSTSASIVYDITYIRNTPWWNFVMNKTFESYTFVVQSCVKFCNNLKSNGKIILGLNQSDANFWTGLEKYITAALYSFIISSHPITLNNVLIEELSYMCWNWTVNVHQQNEKLRQSQKCCTTFFEYFSMKNIVIDTKKQHMQISFAITEQFWVNSSEDFSQIPCKQKSLPLKLQSFNL